MKKMQQGFTLIELMIVVAIIAILAAIALPQYRNYTQKSANGACLAEAKAYMAGGVAAAADNSDASAYVKSACNDGEDMTVGAYKNDTALTFTPQTRGNTALLKKVTCHGGTGNCELVDP